MHHVRLRLSPPRQQMAQHRRADSESGDVGGGEEADTWGECGKVVWVGGLGSWSNYSSGAWVGANVIR